MGLATCLCIHAEENALLEAGRERIGDGKVVLYCDTCPCLTCSIKIVQVGVGEVVYAQGYSMDGETAAVFREAGVRLRQFVPVSFFPFSFPFSFSFCFVFAPFRQCVWWRCGECWLTMCVACEWSNSSREAGAVHTGRDLMSMHAQVAIPVPASLHCPEQTRD